MKSILQFFSSLRLAVVLLLASMILVFCGTIAQVHLGLWEAQRHFFHSYAVWWRLGNGWAWPVWPGGYLLGWDACRKSPVRLRQPHAKTLRLA